MATPGERRALIFLAAVALLGAGTRAWRAKRPPVANGALDLQLEAIDSARAQPRPKRGKAPRRVDSVRVRPVVAPNIPIDLDIASAEEIEKLPGIGPALAKRVIDDRNSKGAFGCLAALDRVKGIGPAMLARLESLAVFSGARGAVCEQSQKPP